MSIPSATYRLQFTPVFGFKQARQILPYLEKLGISHVYASPIFQAKKGSQHGYDVINPCALNRELGTEEEFNRLLQEVRDRGMGWIQDIVPNHMAFDGQNAWLMDVLEKGRRSKYWAFYDIEWKDTYQNLKGKVLAPFLGRFYSHCLEDKEIQLHFSDGNLTVRYYDLVLPLRIETYQDVLLYGRADPRRSAGKYSKVLSQYVNAVRQLKTTASRAGKNFDERIQRIKADIWRLYKTNDRVRDLIGHNLDLFNGQKGVAQSFQLLDGLLSKQLFRLAVWKFGAEEINYRRFFNINQLISVKAENKQVFEQTHGFILDLTRQGRIDGLRVDHIDGLYDPKQYLERLRERTNGRYLIVEKILEKEEQLPTSWPVEGTTGYEFLNYVNGLFVDGTNERTFEKIYRDIVNVELTFDELVAVKKRLIIGKHMAGDIDNLAHHMKRISRIDRYGRDITSYGLKRALVEVMAMFPRYRTYVDGETVGEDDKTVIFNAIDRAKESNPGLIYELDFISDILMLNFKHYCTTKDKRRWVHYVQRFQQFTGPLMAKGFEDTALYVYNRLISLNEVGGDPSAFGVGTAQFHRFNRLRQSNWPHAMNATATHDTKRGEDVRARINVLSEMPGTWFKKIKLWKALNRDKKTTLSGRPAPDNNDEYFFYQTLIGSFPVDGKNLSDYKKRLKDYVIKAVREAKVHTAWIQPDERYEQAYVHFIDKTLSGSASNRFLADFKEFQKNIAHAGSVNSLSQLLIKLTSPGVPDFYQGSELWDLNLVDPDNRRPVDFRKRIKYLNEIDKGISKNNTHLIEDLLARKETGQIKLYLTSVGLRLRRRHERIFLKGRHVPLKVTGALKEHVIAFDRKYKNDHVVTVAPRLMAGAVKNEQWPTGKVWRDTCVHFDGDLSLTDEISGHVFHGRKLYLKNVFKYFPGALLSNADAKR